MSAADAQAAATSRDQWNWFLSQYGSLEEDLVNSVDSNQMVGKAADSAATQVQVGNASLERSMDRYGVGNNMTGVQRSQLDRQQLLGGATSTAQAVNTSRIDQRERNLGVMSDLMQKGRGVSSQALSGLGDAAGMEANRNSANAQAKAQNKANNVSTALGVASLAMMIPW